MVGVEHPADVVVEHPEILVVRHGEIRVLVDGSLGESCHLRRQVAGDAPVTDIVRIMASREHKGEGHGGHEQGDALHWVFSSN